MSAAFISMSPAMHTALMTPALPRLAAVFQRAKIHLRDARQQIRRGNDAQICRAFRDEDGLVGEQAHQEGRDAQHRKEEKPRDHDRDFHDIGENLFDRRNVLLPPILRRKHGLADGHGRQEQVFHKGNLHGQGHRRHLVLRDEVEHDGVGRADRREHKLLQRDGQHEREELFMKFSVTDNCFDHNASHGQIGKYYII